MMSLLDLPEECLLYILSLTSPMYVLRSRLVCKQLRSIADSDLLWEKLLPVDFDEIISQLSSPLVFKCKKELVLYLCKSHVLFKGGTKSFSLDKWTGKKCYMIGAKELSIGWKDNARFWTWRSLPDSRFPEVAELLDICPLEISGKIRTSWLSPYTTYRAYFWFKLSPVAYGFDDAPVQVSVKAVVRDGTVCLGDRISVKTFYLMPPKSIYSFNQEFANQGGERWTDGEFPHDREDRWIKLDMGRYFNRGGDAGSSGATLHMTLKDVDDRNWKSGLIVYGIELRSLE